MDENKTETLNQEYDRLKEEVRESIHQLLAKSGDFDRMIDIERTWRFPSLKEQEVPKAVWDEITCVLWRSVYSSVVKDL